MSTDLDLQVRLPDGETGRVQSALDKVASASFPEVSGTALEFEGHDHHGFDVLVCVDLAEGAAATISDRLCQAMCQELGVPVINAEHLDRFLADEREGGGARSSS